MTNLAWTYLMMVACFIAAGFGNAVGHSVVATDCERLGAFYVDKKVYVCELKKEVIHADR